MRQIYELHRGAIGWMSLEAPSGNNLPWMVRAESDKWITFVVKQSSVEKAENERGWSCYTGLMKDIDSKGAEDGIHEIPFWAMDGFYDAWNEAANPDGWQQYAFKKIERNGKNTALFRVD